jgi:hypothetical protein
MAAFSISDSALTVALVGQDQDLQRLECQARENRVKEERRGE